MGFRNAVNFFIGLVFIISALVGVYLVARAAFQGFASLETGTASAVAATGGAVLLAIINHAAQRYLDRRRDIEARQRERKIEIYQRFMRFWFDFLLSKENRNARAKGEQNIESVLPELNEITQQLILWGSDRVLKSYSDFRRYITSESENRSHVQTLALFEVMLYEFRKDLGHSNRKLEERDILALFVNDVDKLKPNSDPAITDER